MRRREPRQRYALRRCASATLRRSRGPGRERRRLATHATSAAEAARPYSRDARGAEACATPLENNHEGRAPCIACARRPPGTVLRAACGCAAAGATCRPRCAMTAASGGAFSLYPKRMRCVLSALTRVPLPLRLKVHVKEKFAYPDDASLAVRAPRSAARSAPRGAAPPSSVPQRAPHASARDRGRRGARSTTPLQRRGAHAAPIARLYGIAGATHGRATLSQIAAVLNTADGTVSGRAALRKSFYPKARGATSRRMPRGGRSFASQPR